MIITAESGASKTDWIIDGTPFRTKGINCSVMSEREIASVVSAIAGHVRSSMESDRAGNGVSLWFYGAGLVSDGQVRKMTEVLQEFFPGAAVHCASDLLAAARALWGDEPGIVAILGTGSNSCSYNGKYITANVLPGGYILGDEGGGVSLGRKFISDYIKELVPDDLAEEFRSAYRLKYPDIVDSVYKGQNPAGFLASFAPFIIEAAGRSAYAETLVRENLRSFVTRSLLSYRQDGAAMRVGVAGSVGYVCRSFLEELGTEYGMDFCRFIQSPITALADYHSRKNSNFASVSH